VQEFTIDIGNVPIFVAALLGAALVFLFCALAIRGGRPGRARP